MVDLCYQTLALAEIDRAKYAAQIKANADRILSLQRESGQWSMRFEANQPEVEFQTGHALWALAAAGVPSVVFGPGDIAQAHTCDEWIALDQLDTAAEILFKLATIFE